MLSFMKVWHKRQWKLCNPTMFRPSFDIHSSMSETTGWSVDTCVLIQATYRQFFLTCLRDVIASERDLIWNQTSVEWQQLEWMELAVSFSFLNGEKYLQQIFIGSMGSGYLRPPWGGCLFARKRPWQTFWGEFLQWTTACCNSSMSVVQKLRHWLKVIVQLRNTWVLNSVLHFHADGRLKNATEHLPAKMLQDSICANDCLQKTRW